MACAICLSVIIIITLRELVTKESEIKYEARTTSINYR